METSDRGMPERQINQIDLDRSSDLGSDRRGDLRREDGGAAAKVWAEVAMQSEEERGGLELRNAWRGRPIWRPFTKPLAT
jgi:hypothetical protein